MSDSYHNARVGGISDGTVEGQRGANDYQAHKRHLEAQKQMFSSQQQANSVAAGQQVADGIWGIIAGLFLNKYFSFVGFYLICIVFLGVNVEKYDTVIANLLGLDVSDSSTKTGLNIFVFGLPVILAVLLRKIIPTMMRWIFYIIIGGITLAFVGGIIWAIIEKTAST